MTSRPPLVVLDAPDEAGLEDAARALERAGWRLRDGLHDLPVSLDAVVCRSVVADDATVKAAILAAAWGAGVLLAAGRAPAELRERLVDDLARIGPVTRSVAAAPRLHPDAERLLGSLAEGRSLAEAAAAAYLSRRTADRRLAEARMALGATTTSEAIARWLSAAPPPR
jgi:hypothetical protein